MNPLSKAQAAALKASTEAGFLQRTRAGYTGISRVEFHSSRTVFALERAGYLAYVAGQGETRLEPTAKAWKLATQLAANLHVKHDVSQAAAA